MKKINKIILAVIAAILAVAIVCTGIVFWYYPRYRHLMVKNISPEKSDFGVNIDIRDLEKGEIRAMSCNVRCKTPSDLLKKSWYYRAPLIANNIKNEKPTVIGFQEVTVSQYAYLILTLPQYDSVIRYRDDSMIKEGTPIFFRKDLYELKDKGSFWLSATPEKMSKDWGAACYRICSYVILTDRATGKDFVVFNTHLDHVSDKARINGINVVLDKIKQFGSMPAILMGDFNAEEDTKTYRSATENFDDVKYLTNDTMKSCTFQNYGKELDSDCIDYIMVSKDDFIINSYKVVTTTYDGVYPSDHFQLVASMKLK